MEAENIYPVTEPVDSKHDALAVDMEMLSGVFQNGRLINDLLTYFDRQIKDVEYLRKERRVKL